MAESMNKRGWQALWGVLLWTLALLAPSSAHAIGLLVPTEQALPPLAIRSHRVEVQITDAAAVTRVDQVFVNHTDRPLEATYYFPVPPGSTVSDFSLWINGVKTPGAVLEKDKARSVYEQIVRRTQDPGLVEYVDGTLFQARIFPVPARGEQRVEIRYATVLGQVNGLRQLRYPLKTGRRTATLLDDFTMTVRVSSRAPLQAIYSPSHQVAVSRRSDHEAVVGFEDVGVDLEEDFLLYLGTGQEDVGLSVLTWDGDGAGGEDGYFLMVMAPRLEATEAAIPRKAVTFVVDTSGSMTGEKIKQARAALASSLQKLRGGDLFNVVRFSTDVQPLFLAPQPATPENVRRGVEFAQGLQSGGGTAIDEALQVALQQPVPGGVPHFALFMTDGLPTVGETQPGAILARARQLAGATRVFTFGVGFDVNAALLDQLAEGQGGQSAYIAPQEDIESAVVALNNRIAYPSMTEVRVDYGSPSVYDVWPRKLPDLFRGGQVVLLGRYRGAMPGRILLSGQVQGQGVTVAYDETEHLRGGAAASQVHDFIPKLWATRKVGYLLSEIRLKGEVPELRDEVIRLGRTYGLVTPYTSYLAVDDSELQGGQPGQLATPSPIRHRHIKYNFEGDDISGELLKPSGRMIKLRDQAQAEGALTRQDNLGNASGRGSVATSVEMNRLKQAEANDKANATRTRWVDGKLFVQEGETWVEQGVDRKKARRVKVGSAEYFKLMEERPAMRKRMAVDRNVVIDFDDMVIETF